MFDVLKTEAGLREDVVAAQANLRECQTQLNAFLAAKADVAFVAVDDAMMGWAGIVSVRREGFSLNGRDGPYLLFSFDEEHSIVVSSQRSQALEHIVCRLRIGDDEQTTEKRVTLRAFFIQKEAQDFLRQRGYEIIC